MAQIITITNQKGGVGKTTISSALICGLHQRGARVLGVDTDPQGNLGFTLGLDPDNIKTLYDVFTGSCTIQEAISHTEYGDILPSDIMLSSFDVLFPAQHREYLLSQYLASVKDQYDFIIIDTPPSLNILTINAYVASTGLIIPMESEILSLVGVSQILETVEAVRASFNPHLRVLGILMNRFDSRTRLSREVLEMAEEVANQMDSHVFPVYIRRGVDVARAPAYGQSVLSYRPTAKPAIDLGNFVDLIAGDKFSSAQSANGTSKE